MNTPNFSDRPEEHHAIANSIATLLRAQGLCIPNADQNPHSTIGADPAFIEMARQMDPLDLPPGDPYRAYARRDGRKRDPAKDGMEIGFTCARTMRLHLAPAGVWWFPYPCLVARDWVIESEGRGPFVVTDLRSGQVLTADKPEDLLQIAAAKGFAVQCTDYLLADEELVLTLSRAYGTYWD